MLRTQSIFIIIVFKASQEGHKSVVELLLLNKADVNIKEKEDNSTALHIGN